VTFATTEHFTVQTARGATVSEANGRATVCLAALSSNLIALAFIGQSSRLGTAFYAFAMILLPLLAFMGVATFQPPVQPSIEDIAHAQRIARLLALSTSACSRSATAVTPGLPLEGIVGERRGSRTYEGDPLAPARRPGVAVASGISFPGTARNGYAVSRSR
jgi:hypothetical protein